ncbi:MAG: DUF4345 family protein [Bacteroidota bacterium]
MEIFETAVLWLSGLVLVYASSIRLLNPHRAKFLQTLLVYPGSRLQEHIDLVNEIRAVGTVLLLGGILILLGINLPGFRQASFVVANLLFAGIVLGRLISFGVDGKPSPMVIKLTILELTLAVLNLICCVRVLLH